MPLLLGHAIDHRPLPVLVLRQVEQVPHARLVERGGPGADVQLPCLGIDRGRGDLCTGMHVPFDPAVGSGK